MSIQLRIISRVTRIQKLLHDYYDNLLRYFFFTGSRCSCNKMKFRLKFETEEGNQHVLSRKSETMTESLARSGSKQLTNIWTGETWEASSSRMNVPSLQR